MRIAIVDDDAADRRTLHGGAAIRIMDGEEIVTVGSFIPRRDDPDP